MLVVVICGIYTIYRINEQNKLKLELEKLNTRLTIDKAFLAGYDRGFFTGRYSNLEPFDWQTKKGDKDWKTNQDIVNNILKND